MSTKGTGRETPIERLERELHAAQLRADSKHLSWMAELKRVGELETQNRSLLAALKDCFLWLAGPNERRKCKAETLLELLRNTEAALAAAEPKAEGKG